jgi:HK97 family phage portal protein
MQATAWGSWFGEGTTTYAGVTVNAETSVQLLAVYGSVRLIADSISTLPVDCYRELPDSSRIEIESPGWLEQPTVDLSFVDWCGQVLSSLLLHGNAYVAVLRNDRGTIVELVPLDPTRISVHIVAGRKAYRVAGVVYEGEIMHIKGLMAPGAMVGMSPVEAARQSIGLGLASVEYGSKFFDNEGNMPGVIEIPGKAQPDNMKAMAEAWRRKRSRTGKGLPGVLESGATWKPTGVTNEQAQFLATRQFTAAEIAGSMFLLDPSDLGIPVAGTSLTYANLADRNARRVQVALLPWIIRIEKAISALMASPRYMKLNLEGLLRGNLKERYEAYEIASRINAAAALQDQPPLLLTTEMRDIEDLPPIPGYPRPPGEEALPAA